MVTRGDVTSKHHKGKGSELRGCNRRCKGAPHESASPALDQPVGPEGSTIASLPCGVLSHIFECLGPRDLALSSCVCRSWHRLVTLEAASNLVWRSFYSSRWQLSGAHWPAKPQPSSSSGCAGRPVCTSITTSSTTTASAAPAAPASTSAASAAAPATPAKTPDMRWQWVYGNKMVRLRSWSGRYSADQVVGHRSAVRAVRLLPACSLLATASLDRTVRLWDLPSGLPLAASRPHGGTVRCLALQPGLLASGCSDHLVRVWQRAGGYTRSSSGSSGHSGGMGAGSSHSGGYQPLPLPLFDVASKPFLLRGHTGPVSCLA
ncbi:hypothetical protein Agub_g5349, partial [Astrephomene gubernaculifera]